MSSAEAGGFTEVDGVIDLSVAQVRSVLMERYDLQPTHIQPLDSELATVCRITGANGSMAVKVGLGDPFRRRAALWRASVMANLAGQGQPVADIVVDRDGALVSPATVEGVDVTVVVEHWLEGVPLRTAHVDQGLLRKVGHSAGRLSASLASAPPAPAGLTHVWEASRSKRSILDVLPNVQDAQARDLVERALDRFTTDVEPIIGALPSAVVHQDLHDDNILVSPDPGARHVVGVLDFGDMLTGLRVAELAVCAGYASRLTSEPTIGFLAVVEGWGQELSLTEAEAVALLPLACTRLAANIAIWAARSTTTRSTYAAARSARSVPALTELLLGDGDRIAEEVRALTHS